MYSNKPDKPLSHHLFVLGQRGLFYVFLLVFFLLDLVVFSYPHIGPVRVHFFLIALFYWSYNRPSFIPYIMSFALGIMMDAVEGIPIGVNGLLFLLIHWFVVDQRTFLSAQSFYVIWLGFTLLMLAYAVVQFLFFSLINLEFMFSPTLWLSVFFSIGLFPAVYVVLHFIHRIISYEPDPDSFGFGN